MKVKAFEEFVAGNARMNLDNLEYSFVGLAGETGEIMEWFKKSHYRGDTSYTEDMLKLELGDALHYITRITLQKGWTLKDLMDANVVKLKARKSWQ